jgi:hypothetical protein
VSDNLEVATNPPASNTDPPPGTELVYQILSDRVTRQLSDADSLDNKLGVAIAALIALTGAIYAVQLPRIPGGVILGLILVALIQAVRGFIYDEKFAEGADTKFLADRMILDSPTIKWHSIEVLKAAYKANRNRLDRKGRLLSQVGITMGVVGSLVLIGKIIGVT